MPVRHPALRLAAAVLTAAAGAVVPPVLAAPAQASACSAGSGVTVVVDPHQLGGGVQQECVGQSGKASSLFPAAGFPLTRAQRDPGFVCRVSGAPASDPCVVTSSSDAYWGLWWSNGTSGSWVYSAYGVDGLSVPDGGSVAFSWDQGAGSAPPGVSAPVTRAAAEPSATASSAAPAAPAPTKAASGRATPAPKPSAKASVRPSAKPSVRATPAPAAPSGSSSPAATPSASAGTSASNSASGTNDPTASPSGSPTGTPTPGSAATFSSTAEPFPSALTQAPSSDAPDTVPTGAPASADDGGLPVWVGPGLLVVLAAAAGATAVVRRRSRPTP